MGCRDWHCVRADRCRLALLATYSRSIRSGFNRPSVRAYCPVNQPQYGKYSVAPRAGWPACDCGSGLGGRDPVTLMHPLSLTKEQLLYITDHVHVHEPLEACGLLAGKNSRVEKVIAVRNQAQSPVRYMMDPIEQLTAFQWIESQGLDLLGIFHSHPAGPEVVSPIDIAEAAYAVIHVIL